MISLVDNKNIEKARKFHYERVREILNKVINKKIGFEKVSKEHKLNDEVIQFLKRYPNIIISGKPKLLLKINEKYNALKLDNSEREKAKLFFKYLYEKHFQKLHSKGFLNEINIDTCIYCNRNYTLDFKNLNNSRAQLDHWFPKSKFPILALSFYNLIPSCSSCNYIKGEGDDIVKKILNINSKKKPLVKETSEIDIKIQKWWEEKALNYLCHPYLKYNEFKFTWFFDGSFNKTKVEFKSAKINTLNTLEFNRTKEIYNSHSNKELKDLLELRYKYSENYIDILINKTFKGIMSEEEIYRMIFGIEIEEDKYHERPFSKFKHNIIEELKNIK